MLGKFSLLEAQLVTGRTHQLRVQLAYLGFQIVGDDKYGDFATNKNLVKHGVKTHVFYIQRLQRLDIL